MANGDSLKRKIITIIISLIIIMLLMTTILPLLIIIIMIDKVANFNKYEKITMLTSFP